MTHFTRLRSLRKRARDHHLYEWFGVENLFPDFEILEQIAEEIVGELQNDYISPYKTQSREKTENEKKEARLLQSITFRYMHIIREPKLKAEYDYELEKEIRTQRYQEHIDSLEQEAVSRTQNPYSWAPREEMKPLPSTSDSEIIETEDLSDESIDAPPIITTFNSNIADDNTITKERRPSSLTKPLARNTPANRARYRQKKLKQRRQMWLIFLGSLAGILLGYLLLKVLEI